MRFRSVGTQRRLDVKRGGVCITGVGAATPLGNCYEEIADRLLSGISGVQKITRFPLAEHPVQIAAAVDTIPRPAPFGQEDFASLRNTDQLMLWCAVSALQSA